jgi:hypothetical protein
LSPVGNAAACSQFSLSHSTPLSSLMCSDALSISSLTQVGTAPTIAKGGINRQ